MNLSPHFSLHELTVSEYAVRNNIANVPLPEDMEALRELCDHVLEPLRALLKAPILVTSGYRCPELNKAIGGAASSQHTRGQAADIHVNGTAIESLFQIIINSEIEYDQCIQEFGQWVHISYNKNANRRDKLRAVKEFGQTKYERA